MDRRTINILLAALDVEQREVACRMGYDPQYVVNVLNGHTKPSRPFRRAFGDAVAELILGNGDSGSGRVYPAAPLVALIEKHAEQAPSRRDFFADLGINCQGFGKRKSFSEAEVDRLCCDLGVHPSDLYPTIYSLGEAS